jgi:hypothetical protein
MSGMTRKLQESGESGCEGKEPRSPPILGGPEVLCIRPPNCGVCTEDLGCVLGQKTRTNRRSSIEHVAVSSKIRSLSIFTKDIFHVQRIAVHSPGPHHTRSEGLSDSVTDEGIGSCDISKSAIIT